MSSKYCLNTAYQERHDIIISGIGIYLPEIKLDDLTDIFLDDFDYYLEIEKFSDEDLKIKNEKGNVEDFFYIYNDFIYINCHSPFTSNALSEELFLDSLTNLIMKIFEIDIKNREELKQRLDNSIGVINYYDYC